MSENLPSDGKKRRGRPPRKRETEDTIDASPDDELGHAELDKDLILRGRLKVRNIPEGPYQNQSAQWNACFIMQSLNQERQTLGVKVFGDEELRRRMRMTAVEIEEVIRSDGYQKFRISKSAALAQQTIADVVPSLRVAVVEFMNQLKYKPKCEKCGRMSQDEISKLGEGLEFVVKVMDKFGLPKIDTSFAENTEDLDTEMVIVEAQELVKEICTWPNLAPQRVLSALVDFKADKKTKKTGDTEVPPKTGSADRPNEVVHPVRLPEAVIPEPKEISGDDIEQSVGEIGVADGGLHDVRTGETSDGENTEERSPLALGGEER